MGTVPWTVYAPTRRKEHWKLPDGIDWKTVDESVKRLQMRIANAAKLKKYRLMRSLQWLLAHSFYGKLLAVRRVTSNKGKNTPGVDGVVWKTSRQKSNAVKLLYRRGYRSLPLRRVYIWLTQKALAELFGKERSVITKHLKNIFETVELDEKSNVQKMHVSGSDKPVSYYNLDVIIAVGYRVNSYQATQFRIWATKTLKEFIIKGFVLDDERLKQGKTVFGKDYFEELLERIREIRASERRFYQKITDIYALAADYDANSPITKEFFASVQNKLHWAITGKTAAEIVYDSADATKIYMGLTGWKHAPDGKILKSDVTVAKNYLNKAHIDELNGQVSLPLGLRQIAIV
jgi:hypothetical protein